MISSRLECLGKHSSHQKADNANQGSGDRLPENVLSTEGHRQVLYSVSHDTSSDRVNRRVRLHLFDLVKLEFDGRFAAEDRDKRANLLFFGLDLVHDAREVEERS